MNFKEKFDELILFIENNIRKNNTDILVLVKDNFAYGDPSYLAHAFDYITGMRLKEYINRRKLIHIFKYKKDNDCTIEFAASKFDYSSETNYMRDFKKHFNTTVSKMTAEEFEIAFTPLYIKTILEMEGKNAMTRTLTIPEPKIFDLPVYQLSKIREAISLMEFYNLEPEEAEVAYQLTKNTSLNVESIFGFCSDYFDHIEHVKKRYPEAKIENLAILCVKTGVCVRQGLEMMLDIDENYKTEDYSTIPDLAWNIIMDDTLHFDYEVFPHLVLYTLDKMKQHSVSMSDAKDVFIYVDLIGDIDVAVESYNDIYDDDITDDDFDEYLETKRVLDEEYSTIDATFNSDFLGY